MGPITGVAATDAPAAGQLADAELWQGQARYQESHTPCVPEPLNRGVDDMTAFKGNM